MPTIWIGAPIRYAHSYAETFDMKDALAAVDLVRETVLSVTQKTQFNLVADER